MKTKILSASIAMVISAFAQADLTTSYTSKNTATYQTPAHFEHTFGESTLFKKQVIEPGIDLDEVLGTEEIDDNEIVDESLDKDKSPEYIAWQKFCDNAALTKEEYLIIDEGMIPDELLENCQAKGSNKFISKESLSNEVKIEQKAEEIASK